MWSEAIKVLKGEYAVRAIKEHKMDQAIIFCRTKIDCDNMEQYFIQQGGGRRSRHYHQLDNKISPLTFGVLSSGPDSKGHQFSCVCLHGDRKPNERKNNLERFKVKKKTSNVRCPPGEQLCRQCFEDLLVSSEKRSEALDLHGRSCQRNRHPRSSLWYGQVSNM